MSMHLGDYEPVRPEDPLLREYAVAERAFKDAVGAAMNPPTEQGKQDLMDAFDRFAAAYDAWTEKVIALAEAYGK